MCQLTLVLLEGKHRVVIYMATTLIFRYFHGISSDIHICKFLIQT